ncbi:hypothetical protein LUZ61_016996 [Rhynchospora tenuis]|uniref:snRNA-activating protein complex subunit 1 n=1 Tax=Rhynchospora tenuis TaxID=198213 RepID=A0AAD5Z6J6_9POAL|nr:hypothetical protein LUZ61_016996 [Rhynchospora tenuis]
MKGTKLCVARTNEALSVAKPYPHRIQTVSHAKETLDQLWLRSVLSSCCFDSSLFFTFLLVRCSLEVVQGHDSDWNDCTSAPLPPRAERSVLFISHLPPVQTKPTSNSQLPALSASLSFSGTCARTLSSPSRSSACFVFSMDLGPFRMDIDELLCEFTEGNYLTLDDFKRIWIKRKFSYIFEARPTRNSAFFMQSLYRHCISRMISEGPLSRRLGAVYCLYCLHEIQPYKPGFKIYLSLGELRKLRKLIEEAKQNKLGSVVALVKRMIDKNMFLFGFVDMLGNTTQQRVDGITMQQLQRVEVAYDKLFANSNLERYLHTSLGADLEVENYKKMLSEYEQAKSIGVQEASATTDVGDVKHIIENKKTAADVMDEIVNTWDAEKDEYYEKTGISRPDQIVAADDYFDKEFQDYLG